MKNSHKAACSDENCARFLTLESDPGTETVPELAAETAALQ